jgi:hypothetical protein
MTINNGGGGAIFAPPGIPVSAPLGHRASGPTSAYAAAVKADSPVAYYRLGHASGSEIDQMGGVPGAYAGSLAVGASLLPHGDGASTVFSGGSLSVPDSPPTRIGPGPVSYDCWLNMASFSNFMVLVDNVSRPYAGRFDGMQSMFLSFGGNNYASVSLPQTLVLGTSYYLAVTWDAAGNVCTYINGVQSTSTHAPGAVASSTGFTVAGPASGTDPAFAGSIQEFALYNKVLSPARVSAHYAAG